jgi:hypothetical protein
MSEPEHDQITVFLKERDTNAKLLRERRGYSLRRVLTGTTVGHARLILRIPMQ